jgi:BON domain-containing protein/SPW repeat-containing protein
MDRNRNRLNRVDDRGRLNVASGLNVLAGLWLIATPWIYSRFAPNDAGVWNSIIVGIIVTVFAAARFYGRAPTVGLAWVNTVLGAWMIASPFVFGYATDTLFIMWNSIIAGVVVFVLSVVSATAVGTPEVERYPYGGFFGPYDRYGAQPYGPFALFGHAAPGWERSVGPAQGWAGGEHRGRGPRGYRRSDEQIKIEVCDVMSEHPALDATDIEVRITGGEVTLVGAVSSRYAKRLAEDLADSVSGVRDVHNELRIAGRAAAEAPRRIA